MTHKFTHFAQLESLRASLASDARKRAEADQLRIATEAAAVEATDEFRIAIGDVIPLSGKTRVEHKRAPHPPIAHKRREDDQLVLVASVSDEFEIDTLLHTDDELSFQPARGRPRRFAPAASRRMGDSGRDRLTRLSHR